MSQEAIISGTQNTIVPAISAQQSFAHSDPLLEHTKEKRPENYSLNVQRKLAVGAPDDPYEKEADAVADKVIRMPDNNFVQRKCAACEEEEKISRKEITGFKSVLPASSSFLQRKCTACEGKETEVKRTVDRHTPFIQTKSAAPSEGGNTVVSGIESSRGKGSGLEGNTRSFMEERFGTDFGAVKIHTGNEAVQMSRDLNAQAFTVGSDIYFNKNKYQPENTEGKHLLAHELTHVVQQGGSGTSVINRVAQGPFIQRAYWVGADPSGKELTGTSLHNEILSKFGQNNSDLFIEAPVPNADLQSAGYNIHGIADLYKASTTVAVEFPGHFSPAYLAAPSKLRLGNKPYPHKKDAAPYYGAGKIKLDNAPSSIKLGDLKPYGAEELDPKYEEQVGNYVKGFNIVKNEINEMAADPVQKDRLSPAGNNWSVSVDKMGYSDVTIHPDYKIGSPSTPSRRIILKEGKYKKHFVKQAVKGKLFIAYRKDQQGIWNYLWAPDTPITASMLPPGVAAMQINLNTIISPLTDVRLQAKMQHDAVTQKPQPPEKMQLKEDKRIRKKDDKSGKKDNFNYTDWEGKWKEFNKNYKAVPESEKEDADAMVAGRESQKELSSKFSGISDGGAVAGKEKENIKMVKQLHFWSHPLSHYVGKLRQFFGRAFVTAYNVIQSIKTKVGNLLKRGKAAISKSGLAGAVIKLFIKIFKIVGKYMVDKTIDLVLSSIMEGFRAKINAFIDSLVPDEVEEYIEKIKGIQAEFEKIAIDKIESLFEPYLENFKTFKEIEEKASMVMTIVNLVRWGARVIACASPPAIGCLWAIAQSVIEEIAARVVDSCWFIRKVGSRVADKLMAFEMVYNLPVTAARFIIKTANSLLPAGWQDTFPEPTASDLLSVKASYDGSCPEEEEGGGGGGEAFDPLRQEILELINEIGEDKFLALLELSQKRGAGPWILLTKERLDLLKGKLEGITAEQLREAAKDTSKGVPVDIEEFLKNITKYTPAEKKLIGKAADEKKKQAELKEGGVKDPGGSADKGPGAGGGISYTIIKGPIAFDDKKAGYKSMAIQQLTIKAKKEDVKSGNIYDASLIMNYKDTVIHIPSLKVKVDMIQTLLTSGEQAPPDYYLSIPEELYIKFSTGEIYKLRSMSITETLISFTSL